MTVVPMLAPRMTPMAWWRFISPALTKPISMTVVAEEDWMRAVIPAPEATAVNRLAERASSTFLTLSPATCWRPSDMVRMPKMNTANPPMV